MAQMTPEVSKLLERALSLSVEEQEALADSLISNLGGKVDEGLEAAWGEEIKKRIAELDSARPRPFHGRKCANSIWESCRVRTKAAFHEEASAEYDAAFDWYLERSPDAALRFDAEMQRALRRSFELRDAGRLAHIPLANSCCGGFLSL